MAQLARALVLVLLLALPGSALAAAPIPGAHYSGTTDQNFPINFDVSADGTYLTNVVTTVTGSCGQQYSTNSTFAFPIAAGVISGYDPDKFPYLRMAGTFTSPQQASGTLTATNYGPGPPLFCNALGRTWSASTTATAPGGGGSPGGGDPGGGGSPGGGDPGGGGGSPGGGSPGGAAIAINPASGIKLRPSLTNGFIVPVGVDQPAAISARLILPAKQAKKYGLGKKAVVVAKASEPNGDSGSALEFKFKKAVAKKLKKAKKLTFTLEVTATRLADGVKSTGSRSLTLR